MTTAQETSKAFEDVFANLRKVGEENLKLQQEMFRQWTNFWTGLGQPQTAQADRVREVQKQWSGAVAELARNHREVLNRQYEAALGSLEEALNVGEAKDPAEYRERVQQFYRKAIDCLREVSEAQIGEFQQLVNKWGEMATKAGK